MRLAEEAERKRAEDALIAAQEADILEETEEKKEEVEEVIIPPISAAFSFTPILAEGMPTNFKPIKGAAGHPGALATFNDGNKKWSAKVFFNNPVGENCYDLSSDEKNMISLYDLQYKSAITLKEFKPLNDKKKTYHITKYHDDCIKENMIGLLEKSIYDLFNDYLFNDNLTDEDELSNELSNEFATKWMYKIPTQKSTVPPRIVYGNEEKFEGKLYFTMENPFETIKPDRENAQPTRFYDIKIGKKTVFKEDKGKISTCKQGQTDCCASISFNDGFRLEGVSGNEKMTKLIAILLKQENDFKNIFLNTSYLTQCVQKITGKHEKQQNYRIKPMLMFTEMFSYFGAGADDHNKRQKVIGKMDTQVVELKKFADKMKAESPTKFGFIGSSISVVLNEDDVKINIFDFGHPWIYHENRLLEYPTRTNKTYQDKCKNYKNVRYGELSTKVLSEEAFYKEFPITIEQKTKQKGNMQTLKKQLENLPCIFTVYVHIMQSLYRFEMTLQLLLNTDLTTKPSSRDDLKKIILEEGRFLINSLPFITCDKSFKAVDYINKNLRETGPVYALNDNSEIRNEVSALFEDVENRSKNTEINNTHIFKLIKFFQLYTNPIKNTEKIKIMNVKDDLNHIEKKEYGPNNINLWTFDINEIILYHTNYNRDNFESTVDGVNKFKQTAEEEKKIFDDIHKNYYEGLDSFCTAWIKWKEYDDKRIKRIQEINTTLGEN